MTSPSYPITIFYDGACGMCVAQMDKFRARDREKRLNFVDISSPEFKPESLGIDPKLAQKYIYARDSGGQIVRGVDAFIWLWLATDYYFLPRLVDLPGIKQMGRFFYRLVSRSRYLFGKRKNVCDFHCAKEI